LAALEQTPRWRRRKEARPTEILEAALACFAEKGFAATKLDDVAARAGITRGTLYLYFTSKEELFKAVVRQSVLPILAGRERMQARADLPVAEQLRAFILSIPAQITGTPLPAIPKIIIAESRNFPDLAEFYFAEVLSRLRRSIRALLRRGVRAGEFRKIDIDQVFYCTIGPLIAAILWRSVFAAFDKHAPDPGLVARAHADLLLRGLAAPAAQPGATR
jgi:AcrR family transcriptional regulator